MSETCEFCGRSGDINIRGHHVVPRCKGGKVIAKTCFDCEDFIHKTWSHNELRDTYNTVEKIQADERYRRFHSWLMKQKIGKKFPSSMRTGRDKRKYR